MAIRTLKHSSNETTLPVVDGCRRFRRRRCYKALSYNYTYGMVSDVFVVFIVLWFEVAHVTQNACVVELELTAVCSPFSLHPGIPL